MARIIDPFEQFLDSAGNPLTDGYIDFFEPGSTTVRKTTFADAAQTIPNSNPLLLTGDGCAPNVFGTGSYRAVVSSVSLGQIRQRDPIGGDLSIEFGADWVSTTVYSIGDVVRDGDDYYRSLVNGNVGNQPSTDTGGNWEIALVSSTDVVGTSGKVKRTVADMKVDANLTPGDYVTTLGRSLEGDGNGGKFLIVDNASFTVTPDELSAFSLVNGNIAIPQYNKQDLSTRPYRIILGTGQSNALGKEPGGDTAVNDRVKAWDNVAGAWVTAELNQEPFQDDHNNITLQAARSLESILGVPVYMVLVAQGGLSIDNWLPGAPTTDMFARCQTEVAAALAAAGFPVDESIDAVIWSQGESDDSLEGFFDYSEKFRDVFNRYDQEPWWSEQTRVVASMMAHNVGDDRQNISFRKMRYDNDAPHIQLINSEFLTAPDGVHFSGQSLTDIGKSAAQSITKQDDWCPELLIDRIMRVKVPEEIASLERVFEIFSDYRFSGFGELIIELTDNIELTKTVQIRHPQGDRFLIQGAFAAGKTAPPTLGDFTGVKATDKTMVQSFYEYNITCTGITGFIVGSNSAVRMSTLSVIGDATPTALGIDARDQLNRVGGGLVGLEDVTVIDFDGSGIRVNNGSINALSTDNNVVAYCGTNIFIEQGSTCDLNNLLSYGAGSYGLYSLEGSTANIPNSTIDSCGLFGVYCEAGSYANCDSATFSNNTSNDVRVRNQSSAYIHNAAIGGTTSPAATTDAAGFSIVTV